ncbi:MAG: REP element-mobilizing transposase RayT [Limisphaerales bacterium]|jgi:REP element-mobilizing transposase RayT
MPSTHISLHYHLIFSTKDRRPSIKSEWQNRLHEFLGGTARNLEGFPQGVGGTNDHVHLLVGLKSTHRLADFVRELKKVSSAWVHKTIGEKTFTWQEGYGAFTVSPTIRSKVRQYIANQSEHHRTRSYREELVELLEHSGVDYDPKYLD